MTTRACDTKGHEVGNILRFPVRPAPAGEDRLSRALESLAAALAAQRNAVAGWRATIGELRGSVDTLGRSVADYHDRLDALGDGVGRLHAASAALEAWADRLGAG